MATRVNAEKKLLLDAAKSVSKLLGERHIRRPFRLKHKYKMSQFDESYAGGWCVTIATGGKDCPAIELFLDRVLGSKRPRQFWYGFSSSEETPITRLIERLPRAFKPSRTYRSLIKKRGIYVFQESPSPSEIIRPVAELYKEDKEQKLPAEFLFGKFQLRDRADSPLEAWLAAQFIADVVAAVSSPDVGKIGKAEREYVERLIRDRQPQFRNNVLAAYACRCCITGCAVRHCIEAAHIDRYSESVNNRVTNDIALRADLHRLFDAKLLDFNRSGDDLLIQVDNAIQEHTYRQLHGTCVTLPTNRKYWPEQWF
jgi:hypothetical protein